MHVAIALGVPQMALSGSTDPAPTGPLNDVATTLCRPPFPSLARVTGKAERLTGAVGLA